MTKINAAITAVHGYVPDYVLTNKELETMVDTTEDWILSRTGIAERRILKGENQGTSVMAAEAMKGLLKKAGISAEEIDLVIVGTVTPDLVFPSTANIVCDLVGAKNAWSYDINAACSGFLYSLATGAQFIETGRYKKVVVIGADKMSSIINYEDRTTCIIFGDGAGAVLLEPATDGTGVQDFILKSDGAGRKFLYQPAGGSANPPSHKTIDAKQHYVYQEGQTVFKFAVTNMAQVAVDVLEKNNMSGSDVDWLIAHQANKRIIDATAQRLGLPEEKVLMNIHKYGNTTAGTLPLLLWDFEKKFKKGDNLVFAAFGGGFTWGAIYLKWSYDAK